MDKYLLKEQYNVVVSQIHVLLEQLQIIDCHWKNLVLDHTTQLTVVQAMKYFSPYHFDMLKRYLANLSIEQRMRKHKGSSSVGRKRDDDGRTRMENDMSGRLLSSEQRVECRNQDQILLMPIHNDTALRSSVFSYPSLRKVAVQQLAQEQFVKLIPQDTSSSTNHNKSHEGSLLITPRIVSHQGLVLATDEVAVEQLRQELRRSFVVRSSTSHQHNTSKKKSGEVEGEVDVKTIPFETSWSPLGGEESRPSTTPAQTQGQDLNGTSRDVPLTRGAIPKDTLKPPLAIDYPLLLVPHDPIFIEVVPLPENPSEDVLMSLSKMELVQHVRQLSASRHSRRKQQQLSVMESPAIVLEQVPPVVRTDPHVCAEMEESTRRFKEHQCCSILERVALLCHNTAILIAETEDTKMTLKERVARRQRCLSWEKKGLEESSSKPPRDQFVSPQKDGGTFMARLEEQARQRKEEEQVTLQKEKADRIREQFFFEYNFAYGWNQQLLPPPVPDSLPCVTLKRPGTAENEASRTCSGPFVTAKQQRANSARPPTLHQRLPLTDHSVGFVANGIEEPPGPLTVQEGPSDLAVATTPHNNISIIAQLRGFGTVSSTPLKFSYLFVSEALKRSQLITSIKSWLAIRMEITNGVQDETDFRTQMLFEEVSEWGNIQDQLRDRLGSTLIDDRRVKRVVFALMYRIESEEVTERHFHWVQYQNASRIVHATNSAVQSEKLLRKELHRTESMQSSLIFYEFQLEKKALTLYERYQPDREIAVQREIQARHRILEEEYTLQSEKVQSAKEVWTRIAPISKPPLSMPSELQGFVRLDMQLMRLLEYLVSKSSSVVVKEDATRSSSQRDRGDESPPPPPPEEYDTLPVITDISADDLSAEVGRDVASRRPNQNIPPRHQDDARTKMLYIAPGDKHSLFLELESERREQLESHCFTLLYAFMCQIVEYVDRLAIEDDQHTEVMYRRTMEFIDRSGNVLLVEGLERQAIRKAERVVCKMLHVLWLEIDERMSISQEAIQDALVMHFSMLNDEEI